MSRAEDLLNELYAGAIAPLKVPSKKKSLKSKFESLKKQILEIRSGVSEDELKAQLQIAEQAINKAQELSE